MSIEKIGKISEQIRGVSYSKKDSSNEERANHIAILRAGNINDNNLVFDDLVFVPNKKVNEKQKLILNDVVIAASSGSIDVVGKAAQVKEDCYASFGAFCKVLRPDANKVEPNYFANFFKTRKYRHTVSHLAAGANINNLRNSDLDNLEIPLPPLPEQKRIASILDTADALRTKRRQAIAMLDELLQATFLDMFGDPVTNPKGWEVVTIGDLMSSVNYGSSKKANETDGQYPILRMNNISYSGAWDFSSLKYIDLDEKEKAKHLVYKRQILFNRTNSKELVGKTAVYRLDKPMAFAGYLVRAVVNDENNPEYIGAFMNLPQTKQFLRNKCKNIVGMANINAKEFQKISIQKPPLTLQTQFAKIVEKVEAQKAVQQAHLAELDTLFASLQQRAFAGAL